MSAVAWDVGQAAQADYMLRRVLDAFLREDVGGCVSKGQVIDGGALRFAGRLPPAVVSGAWLHVPHLGDWYLPIASSVFMQDWRVREPFIVRPDGAADCRVVSAPDAVIDCFVAANQPAQAAVYAAFKDEFYTAVDHSQACEVMREAVASSPNDGCRSGLPDWATDHLAFERLAAFQDHPFYPTARAKLGFCGADLSQYAPESGACFELYWLAVPQSIYSAQHDALPSWWPDFVDVGLPDRLRASHRLLPIHPFTWRTTLDDWLAQAGLTGEVIKAPDTWLSVLPTLSVRSLVVAVDPRCHLKVPLPIRTLGARNIRTIKPSTVADGARMQALLGRLCDDDPWLQQHLLLTDESRGATVADQPFLGFILRTYPALPDGHRLVPVAALVARDDAGEPVCHTLADTHYVGDVMAFFTEYVAVTARLHLTLWLRYGIALESNQQNSLLVLAPTGASPRLRIMLKDNDAGRVRADRLAARFPALGAITQALIDRRIVVTEEAALAHMFITITLQLNIAVWAEALAEEGGMSRDAVYERVAFILQGELNRLADAGEDVVYARKVLLSAERHPAKYLLRAASLEDKSTTGAADVNKFYGMSAPNPLCGRIK